LVEGGFEGSEKIADDTKLFSLLANVEHKVIDYSSGKYNAPTIV
jgi:hypothetical protein